MGRGANDPITLEEIERTAIVDGVDEHLQAEQAFELSVERTIDRLATEIDRAEMLRELPETLQLFEERPVWLLSPSGEKLAASRDRLFDELSSYFHRTLLNGPAVALGTHLLMLRSASGTSPLVISCLTADRRGIPHLHLRERPDSDQTLCGLDKDNEWSHGYMRGVFSLVRNRDHCSACRQIARKLKGSEVARAASEQSELRFLRATKGELAAVDRSIGKQFADWLAKPEEDVASSLMQCYLNGLLLAVPKIAARRFDRLSASEKAKVVFDRWMSSEQRVFPDGETVGRAFLERYGSPEQIPWPSKNALTRIYSEVVASHNVRDGDPADGERLTLALLALEMDRDLCQSMLNQLGPSCNLTAGLIVVWNDQGLRTGS